MTTLLFPLPMWTLIGTQMFWPVAAMNLPRSEGSQEPPS